ncbi:hypothetical protein BP5796_03721 [Coleophoma crateriformis]|uniref:IgE-binding protein n=1 Tax=Coleophoma crateriformis TaxID=565419 RepID=A0A3D8SGG6_9HELO|nr:hypothetical protein BP5796_03721 [Coleophoma crateriformis]
MLAKSLTLLSASLALLNTATAALLSLTASLPGSTLDGQFVVAAGQSFALGQTDSPATYCPTVVEPNCPNVTGTIFAGTGALWVEVPGGQATYVTEEGLFGFTQAHSIFVPIGAYQGGWVNKTITPDCEEEEPYTVFTFQAYNATVGGVSACPVTSPGDGSVLYKIYGVTPQFNRTDCVELDGLLPHTPPTNAFGAWQYT